MLQSFSAFLFFNVTGKLIRCLFHISNFGLTISSPLQGTCNSGKWVYIEQICSAYILGCYDHFLFADDIVEIARHLQSLHHLPQALILKNGAVLSML